MKRFLLLIILLFTALVTSCERKTLYLREPSERCDVNTVINVSADINVNLNVDIMQNLVYVWDETLYGKLGYDIPATVEGYVFGYQAKNLKYPVLKDLFEIGVPKKLSILTNTRYDILFYSKAPRASYSFDDYYTYYIVNTDTMKTKAVKYSESFDVIPQADQQFSFNKPDVYIDSENETLRKEIIDGVLTYFYDINVDLQPCSYIYIVQVCVEDDNDRYSMDYDSCLYMGLSGVATAAELFSHMTTADRGCIESRNVKKIQNIDGKCVFAERFVTYGIVKDYSSSWGYNGLSYELGLELRLKNGDIKRGVIDISKEIHEKPEGGVITINLKNSSINNESVSGGGFDVDVQDWKDEINVEISI